MGTRSPVFKWYKLQSLLSRTFDRIFSCRFLFSPAPLLLFTVFHDRFAGCLDNGRRRAGRRFLLRAIRRPGCPRFVSFYILNPLWAGSSYIIKHIQLIISPFGRDFGFDIIFNRLKEKGAILIGRDMALPSAPARAVRPIRWT